MIIAAVLIFGSAIGVSAQDWVKFAPADGGFEMMMPGTPTASVETKDGPEGPVTTSLYILRTAGATYFIGYADYDPKFNFDVRAEINANRDNFMKPFKEGKVLGEKEKAVGGSPGIEFTAELNPTTSMTSRVFVIGRRPYQIAVITPKGSEQADTLRFLDSFKITRK
jgi:hypothetical protein